MEWSAVELTGAAKQTSRVHAAPVYFAFARWNSVSVSLAVQFKLKPKLA
jgi:hypothetical protein